MDGSQRGRFRWWGGSMGQGFGVSACGMGGGFFVAGDSGRTHSDPMRSMTGHGRATVVHGGSQYTVEATSVNRRQAEIAINLPRDLEALEGRLREQVGKVVSRGRVTLRIDLEAGEGAVSTLRVNRPAARAYLQALKELKKEFRLKGAVTLEMLARAPGLLEAPRAGEGADAHAPVLEKLVAKALKGLVAMREREGANLEADLRGRIGQIRAALTRVEALAPSVLERHRETLLARIHAAGLESVQPDDERLLKELVLFADRSDISEEIARLHSHFQQFEDCCAGVEPVGRTLDFLAQELNREVNTIGSKANDGAIAREVVLMKTEVEKFREQAQNVE